MGHQIFWIFEFIYCYKKY